MANREISMNDITKFTKMLHVLKKTTDFHPAVVISKFNTLNQVDLGHILVDQLKDEVKRLNAERDGLTLTLKTYEELKSLGLGLKELKLLVNMIREISNANGIPTFVATTKFCSYIEENYDAILRLESKLEDTRSQIRDEKLKLAAIQSQSYGIDWASFFRLFQVPSSQEKAEVISQGQKVTNEGNAANSASSKHPNPKVANTGVTFHTQVGTKNSLLGDSKPENDVDITDE
jgi:hypothetical protein